MKPLKQKAGSTYFISRSGFSKSSPGTLKSLIFEGGSQGQNYFHKNGTKTLFTLSTHMLSQMYSGFFQSVPDISYHNRLNAKPDNACYLKSNIKIFAKM